MSKYYKLVWSDRLIEKELKAFDARMKHDLGIKSADAGTYSGAAIGDFNGDGYEDVLICYFDKNFQSKDSYEPTPAQYVLLNGVKGNKFVDATKTLPNDGNIPGAPTKIMVDDFNGDGIDDIAVVTSYEDGRSNADDDDLAADQYVLLSSPSGLKKVDLDFRTWGHALTTGDLNGDGLTDFVIAGYTEDPDSGATTAAYLQTSSGELQRLWLPEFSGNAMELADFDADGDIEIVDDFVNWGPDGPDYMGIRISHLNTDRTIVSSELSPSQIVRTEWGIGWSGDKKLFIILKDAQGNEYIDQGVHHTASGDLDGDGQLDFVAVREAQSIRYTNGIIDESHVKNIVDLEFWTHGSNGMELMDLKISGWKVPKYSVQDIRLMDWNGDGHLDIYCIWPESGDDRWSDGAQVYLNDGVGNFSRLSQKLMPRFNDKAWAISDPVDANNDGIIDLLMRRFGYGSGWEEFGKASEQLFLGTKRIFDTAAAHNPARDGAAGFNAAYYLHEMESSTKMMRGAGYETALDHYLAVGKASGAFAFAAGTHVYGYGGSETITLREGNETVDAYGGDDTIIGGAGADKLNGGRGSDTFVYVSVTDSGVSTATRDVIEDFKSGGDKIDLSEIDAVASTSTDDAFAFIASDGAAFTGRTGELRWYSTGSDSSQAKILEGDVDGDGIAEFQIEIFGSGTISIRDLVL